MQGASVRCDPTGVELEDLLNVLDRTAANLAKLETVWERAEPFLPGGYSRGVQSLPEYEALRRAWDDLLRGLPPINGWTITTKLPDLDALSEEYAAYAEAGEYPRSTLQAERQPGLDVTEYKYRLRRTRQRAVRARLQELVIEVDTTLPPMIQDVPRNDTKWLSHPDAQRISAAIEEIERLMGDTAERRGRWTDLHRHLSFGQGHDWHDINEYDWPGVRADIEAAGFTDSDPLPVPDLDLGTAAEGSLTGHATTALPWDQVTDDGFERLLFDLLSAFPDHQNVKWLMQTRAPDRGRDLSFERVIRDGTGSVRIERVIVQAKHWLSKSVTDTHIADTLTRIAHWEPPVIHELVIATSGRFAQDGVQYAERNNEEGKRPRVELWPENRLEVLLSQRPQIAALHRLR